MTRKFFGYAILCVGLASIIGCGPSMAELSGNVSVNGTPLDNGVITFQPEAGSSVPPVAANITKGTFTIPAITYGSYKVTVTPMMVEGAVGGTPEKPAKPGEADPKRAGFAAPKNPATAMASNVTIPQKYRNADTSGLSLKVDKSKIDFPVKLD